ncbi:MAG: hypothetical protein NZO16_03320 [Deltaproteobacteria bacterium]|nr:hypothetical protein [Deltaproteobacteria bacterium]
MRDLFEDRTTKNSESEQKVTFKKEQKPDDLFLEYLKVASKHLCPGESHLHDQVALAVKDFISGKSFSIKTFEDLQLALANIKEIVQHPVLSDELREYGLNVLASIIEALIREEGARRGLDFVIKNFDSLPSSVVREVIPELTNPFLVVIDSFVKKAAEELVDEIESLVANLVEGETAFVRARIKESLIKFRMRLDQSETQNSLSLIGKIKREKNRRRIVLMLLLGIIAIILSYLIK